MLTFSPAVRVFVVVAPRDMRGSFDALAGGVRHLGLDPTDGHLYLFLNKRRRLAKALWFDGSGWCVLGKRLESPRRSPRGACSTAAEVRVRADTSTLHGRKYQVRTASGRRSRWHEDTAHRVPRGLGLVPPRRL